MGRQQVGPAETLLVVLAPSGRAQEVITPDTTPAVALVRLGVPGTREEPPPARPAVHRRLLATAALVATAVIGRPATLVGVGP